MTLCSHVHSTLSLQVEANGEELAVFCGREDSDTEQVPGEQVMSSPRSSFSVSFRSDFSNEERFLGFESHYSAVGERPVLSLPFIVS